MTKDYRKASREIGVGLSYCPALEPIFESHSDLVTFVEIEPQTHWRYLPKLKDPYLLDASTLQKLKRLPQSKIVHGVGFPVGGSRYPDLRHLPPFVETINEIQALWASEHLSFNRAMGTAGEFFTGFLLPPLQEKDGVELASASIRNIAANLPVPFAVETGVNYLCPRPRDLTDSEFITAVSNSADCGIVLDLHNLWANERNGRQSLEDLLSKIPLERVWEIHLAGGEEYQGYWIDSHSGPISEELLRIADQVIPELPNLRAIVFEILAAFVERVGLQEIVVQLKKVREICDKHDGNRALSHDNRAVEQLRIVPESRGTASASDWEDTLGALVLGRETNGSLAIELAEDPGIRIIQQLVCDLRVGMIVDTLKLTCRLISLSLGQQYFEEVLSNFFKAYTPQLFATAEAEAFASYVEEQRLEVPYLSDVLEFERGVIRALLENKDQLIKFRCEPLNLLNSLANGRLPADPQTGHFEIVVTHELSAPSKPTMGRLV